MRHKMGRFGAYRHKIGCTCLMCTRIRGVAPASRAVHKHTVRNHERTNLRPTNPWNRMGDYLEIAVRHDVRAALRAALQKSLRG